MGFLLLSFLIGLVAKLLLMAWTSPRTWTTGETVTATILNTDHRDNLKAIGDPWTAYTPVLSNWAKGNGTLVGKYMQAGKLIHYSIKFTAGSTSTFSGNVQITLPFAVAGADGSAFAFPVGQAGLVDSSGTARGYRTAISTGTTVNLRAEDGTNVNGTVPWTWATGDIIEINGSYEAA